MEGYDGAGPVFWKGGGAPSFGAFDKALEEMRGFLGLGDGEIDDGGGLAGEAAGDVAEEVRPGGGGGDLNESGGVFFDEWGEAEPDELGEVVVGGVISRSECAREGWAIF